MFPGEASLRRVPVSFGLDRVGGSGHGRLGSIVNHVRDDKSRWEENQAEEEVEEEAVPFPRSNPSRPERDCYSDDDQNDRPKPPTTCCNEHLDLRPSLAAASL
jgi:hypothetical protein